MSGQALETTVPGCQTRPSNWFGHQTNIVGSSLSEEMSRMNQLADDRQPIGPRQSPLWAAAMG
jgi:hypothetical protein